MYFRVLSLRPCETCPSRSKKHNLLDLLTSILSSMDPQYGRHGSMDVQTNGPTSKAELVVSQPNALRSSVCGAVVRVRCFGMSGSESTSSAHPINMPY